MTDIAGIDIARIEIHVQESSVRLMAGSTTEHPITLINLTPLPDFFYLAVSGIAANWASFDKESLNLFPNWSDIINFQVTIPAETPAGSYPLEISASSRTQENVSASLTLELIVGADLAAPVMAPPANVQPNLPAPDLPSAPPYIPAAMPGGEYPRLQLDLNFGQLYLLCGQTGEQIVHLLNLSTSQQNFSVGLEGLPPQWLSINPPALNLSPNWSEAVTIKIEVPVDAVPGRYLLGIKAVPTSQPEATTWTQFDLVIIAPPPPVNQPSSFIPAPALGSNGHFQPETAPLAPTSQPYDMPPPVIDAGSVNQGPAQGPARGPTQPPGWTGPFVPVMPPPAQEVKKEPRSGLFSRKNKRKAEPVAPVMYAPPPAPVMFAPVIIPPVSEPEPVETPPVSPQDRATNKLWSAERPAERPAEPAPVIQPALAIPVVEAEAPAMSVVENLAPVSDNTAFENQATELEVKPVVPPEAPVAETAAPEQAETVVEGSPAGQELLVKEPVRITTDNFELTLETSKIEFELGLSAEQKVSLVNLMSNPAFFELQVESLPAEWYSFSYSKINLFPNWKEEVYFRLEAPTDTVPGLFTGKLVVFSSILPDEKVEVELSVNILPSDRVADRLYRATGAGQPVKLPENARIELSLDRYNLSLVPGEKLEQMVSLVNHSPIPDFFELKLDGLMEGWYQFSTPSLNLFPNWNEQFYLLVDLPLSATPGLYPVRLMVKGQSYPELNTEQSILLQVLPPPPVPVVEFPATEEPEPVAVLAVEPGQSEAVAEIEEEEEETDATPGQSFSFASFFQREVQAPPPAPVAPKPADTSEIAPASEVYNQPTGAVPIYNENTNQFSPYQRPNEIAPQTSLAGLIPVITSHEEAPAPVYVPIEYPPMPVAPPPKRTFWQKVTGRGKQPSAPVTPPIDESAFWRPAQAPLEQNQPQLWQNDPTAQASPAANFQPIGGPSLQPQAGQRAYTPISVPKTAGVGEAARVQITLEKPHMTIVAGDTASQQIFLMNLTSLPDNFELTIEGLPGNWFKFENTTLNLFPNWNEHTELTLKVSEKVKPDLYKGRIVASATAQTGVRAIMPIEIEILAPLVVQARLQPHRGKGFKAHYELLLRNRSMSEGLMTMQWSPRNEFSVGQFTPPQVLIGPGQIQTIKLQVMLRKKTPSDQARQAQPFEVLVQPQWTVAQLPVVTAPVTVEGEYSHKSRWSFIKRHPVLFTFLTIILVVAILWNLLLLPFIQNTLLLVSTDKITYNNLASKVLVADQQGFNQQMSQANPFVGLFPTAISFIQEPQKDSKGIVEFSIKGFVFTATLRGTLQVDPVKGDLLFVASNKNQLGSFPWLFLPPDKVVQKLNVKLKTWLKGQNPPQRLDDVYIEGSTLFLKLRNCQIGEVACA